MSHKFLYESSFHLLLSNIDQEMADDCQQAGCRHCGGELHQGNYPRSPHGVPGDFRGHYDSRFSFCCKDCRKRTTPPTVRFFGRYWYVAPVFLLLSALALGLSVRRRAKIKEYFGVTVSKSTWDRWRAWWRNNFVKTKFWQQHKGLCPPADENRGSLPRHLFCAFKNSLDKKMTQILKFLSPLTSGNLRAI